jgi:hypothetical protein
MVNLGMRWMVSWLRGVHQEAASACEVQVAHVESQEVSGVGSARVGGIPAWILGGALLVSGCVAPDGSTTGDAAVGLGDAGAGSSDPHSGHHSSGSDTGFTTHDASHSAESDSHDTGHTVNTSAHGSNTSHGGNTSHDGATSHGSNTSHGGATSHGSDSNHSDSHDGGTFGHTETHATESHESIHTDSTDHIEHSTAEHSTSHVEADSGVTHEHPTTDATDLPDASITDEVDAGETTHDHSDVQVSDASGDASVDGGEDAAHDHGHTGDAADTVDAGVDPGSTDTSSGHNHSSTSTGNSTLESSSIGTTTSASTDQSSSSGTSSDHTDHEEDHCVVGYQPHPSDALMGDGYDVYIETRNGQQYPDATIQTEAIAWMEQHYWQEAHFQWHNARRCPKQPTSDPNDIEICSYPEFVKPDNECENDANGVEFLAMHRHMIQSLKQLFPNHTEQFDGWDSFPDEEDYPELLQEYFQDWSNGVRTAADIADNIEDNVAMFEDEGAFGKWIQCGGLLGGRRFTNLHGALHFNGYSPDNQAHSVANQRRNLDAYLFWKLHGWIDKVWERYRVAKGLQPTDPEHIADVEEQCQEMHDLSELVESLWGPVDPPPDPEPEEVVESGYFHETVRPFLEEARCRGCHGEGTPAAGLQLGFLTSTAIVEQLVNQPSKDASGQILVVPGDPEASWLYQKISGSSETADDVECLAHAEECHQPMPQGNGPMSPEAQAAIREWILDGAPAPTIEE